MGKIRGPRIPAEESAGEAAALGESESCQPACARRPSTNDGPVNSGSGSTPPFRASAPRAWGSSSSGRPTVLGGTTHEAFRIDCGPVTDRPGGSRCREAGSMRRFGLETRGTHRSAEGGPFSTSDRNGQRTCGVDVQTKFDPLAPAEARANEVALSAPGRSPWCTSGRGRIASPGPGAVPKAIAKSLPAIARGPVRALSGQALQNFEASQP